MSNKINLVVLDKIPELAASYLTKRDAQRYYRYLAAIFNVYAKKEKRAKQWLICSKYNYEWYTRFYIAIGDLIGKPVDINTIPVYNSTPYKFGTYFNRKFISKSSPIFKSLMEVSRRKQATAIEYNRLYYMFQNYIASDFITGKLPAWYASKSSVLWEGRDPETMCRIRLDKDNMLGLTFKTETTYNNWDTVQITDPNIVKIIRAILKDSI